MQITSSLYNLPTKLLSSIVGSCYSPTTLNSLFAVDKHMRLIVQNVLAQADNTIEKHLTSNQGDIRATLLKELQHPGDRLTLLVAKLYRRGQTDLAEQFIVDKRVGAEAKLLRDFYDESGEKINEIYQCLDKTVFSQAFLDYLLALSVEKNNRSIFDNLRECFNNQPLANPFAFKHRAFKHIVANTPEDPVLKSFLIAIVDDRDMPYHNLNEQREERFNQFICNASNCYDLSDDEQVTTVFLKQLGIYYADYFRDYFSSLNLSSLGERAHPSLNFNRVLKKRLKGQLKPILAKVYKQLSPKKGFGQFREPDRVCLSSSKIKKAVQWMTKFAFDFASPSFIGELLLAEVFNELTTQRHLNERFWEKNRKHLKSAINTLQPTKADLKHFIQIAAEYREFQWIETLKLLQDPQFDPAYRNNELLFQACQYSARTNIAKQLLQDPRVFPSACDNRALKELLSQCVCEEVEELIVAFLDHPLMIVTDDLLCWVFNHAYSSHFKILHRLLAYPSSLLNHLNIDFCYWIEHMIQDNHLKSLYLLLDSEIKGFNAPTSISYVVSTALTHNRPEVLLYLLKHPKRIFVIDCLDSILKQAKERLSNFKENYMYPPFSKTTAKNYQMIIAYLENLKKRPAII